jgi:hypothetical protein
MNVFLQQKRLIVKSFGTGGEQQLTIRSGIFTRLKWNQLKNRFNEGAGRIKPLLQELEQKQTDYLGSAIR